MKEIQLESRKNNVIHGKVCEYNSYKKMKVTKKK